MSLLIGRLIPVNEDLRSPAELLNRCEYQSNLPSIRKTSKQTLSHKERLVAKQAKIKDYHHGNNKELKPLSKGQDVLYKLNPDNNKMQWSKGVILDRNDKSYMIQTKTGRKLFRKRVNVRPYKNRIPQSRHVKIEPKVLAAKKPVFLTNLTRLV